MKKIANPFPSTPIGHLLVKMMAFGMICCMGCIDPFDLTVEKGEGLLTIDAILSTAPGPQRVRLTRSDTYGSVNLGAIRAVNDARVAIRDREGNITFLTEQTQDSITFRGWGGWETRYVGWKTGIYHTPENFPAQIGQTYTLLITTANGKSYSSLPEMVRAVPALDELELRPYKQATSNPLIYNTGFDILVRFSDTPGTTDHYLWKHSKAGGVLRTFPDRFLLGPNHPTCPRCPAPKPCCERCYLPETRLGSAFSVTNDDLFDGQAMQHQIFSLPDDGIRFLDRYRIQIDQYAISPEAHKFLSLVKQQLSVQGSVFDPPPANIRGNMISLDDAGEQVLGYFMAGDVSSKLVYIDRQDLPAAYRHTPQEIPDDCREFQGFTGSGRLTTTFPEDWIP